MKRLISLLVVLSLLTLVPIPTLAKAETSSADFKANAKILTAFGIADTASFMGDKASDSVTKAEAVAFIIKLLNVDYSPYVNYGFFKDVSPATQYREYINFAASMGYLDTSVEFFKPTEKITFNEFLRILLEATGYGKMAISQGGFPMGYISIGQTKGFLKGVTVQDVNINRQTVAKVLCNALNVPLIKIVKVAADGKYTSYEGQAIMTECHNVYKEKGFVDGVFQSSIYATFGLKTNDVSIDGIIFDKGNTDLQNYLGYNVSYYYQESEDGQDKILYYQLLNDGLVEILGDRVLSGSTAEKICYEDEAGNIQSIEIAKNATIIYNGAILGTDYSADIFDNCNDKIVLNSSKGDGNYDVVIVNSLETFLVDTVNSNDKIIKDKISGKFIKLDEKESKISVTVNYFLEGTLANIKFGDVLSVSRSTPNVITEGSITFETSRLYNIYVMPKGRVSGNLQELSDENVTIDGKTYKFDKSFRNQVKSYSVSSGTVFLLNKYGYISGIDAKAVYTSAYGYVVNYTIDKLRGTSIELYNQDGLFEKYNIKAKTKSNGGVLIKADELISAICDKDGKFIPQLVRFSSNEAGEITEFYHNGTGLKAVKIGWPMGTIRYLKISGTSNNRFGVEFALAPEAVVFKIPADLHKRNHFKVLNSAYFMSDIDYYVQSYDEDEFRVAKAIVVSEPDSGAPLPGIISGNFMAVFDHISYALDEENEGEVIMIVNMYYSGSLARYRVSGNPSLINTIKTFEFGDLIRVVVSNSGVLENAIFGYRFNAGEAPKGTATALPNSDSGRGNGFFDSYIGTMDFQTNYMTAYVYETDLSGNRVKKLRNYTIVGNIVEIDFANKKIYATTDFKSLYPDSRALFYSSYSTTKTIFVFK